MATLNFTKSGNVWVAEATVHGDYVIHVERKRPGRFYISQRSAASGQYAPCFIIPPQVKETAGAVIDHAFGHGVYPSGGMHVRFASESEVTAAEINEGA